MKSSEVMKYIDKTCENSCLVFVNGQYSSTFSKTTAIPAGLIFGSLRSLNEPLQQDALHLVSDSRMPDMGELPRNQYGSEVLSALTLVSERRRERGQLHLSVYACFPVRRRANVTAMYVCVCRPVPGTQRW